MADQKELLMRAREYVARRQRAYKTVTAWEASPAKELIDEIDAALGIKKEAPPAPKKEAKKDVDAKDTD